MGRIGSSQGSAPLDGGGYVANAVGGDWFLPTSQALGNPGLRYVSGASGGLDGFTTHALTLTAGTVYGSRIFIPAGETISSVAYAIQTASSSDGITAENWVGIYSAAGNLLWTSADQTTNFKTAGLYVLSTGSPIVVPVGNNWVDIAILGNATTTQITPWVHLYTTLTPAIQCLSGTTGPTAPPNQGFLGWTGRTSATTLAATTGTQTSILTNIFTACG
jgi:hypothetical protein